MRAAALAVLLCGGCPVGDGVDPPDAGPPGDAGTVVDSDGFLPVLDDEADLDALADDSGAVKYLVPVAGVSRAPLFDTCAFQDTAQFPFHIQFLRTLPGGEELTFDEYVALVLQRESRAWWGGELIFRDTLTHPISGASGVLVYSLYTEDSPGNRLEPDDVRDVHAVLQRCAPVFAAELAFLPTSPEQRATAQQAIGALAEEGIGVVLQ